MALLLEMNVGDKVYLLSEEGMLCEFRLIEVIGDCGKISVGFSLSDSVEVLRHRVLKKILVEKGSYDYPIFKKNFSNECADKINNILKDIQLSNRRE